MKIVGQVLSISIVVLGFSKESQAQNLRTNAFKVNIQSDKDIIQSSQVDAACIKDRKNKEPFVFQTSVESQTTRISHNKYEFSVSPIKVGAPTMPKLIACNIALLMYIEPGIYLKFIIFGSNEQMDPKDISPWIENPDGLTKLIVQSFSKAKLFHAKYPQNYVLKLGDRVIYNTYYK